MSQRVRRASQAAKRSRSLRYELLRQRYLLKGEGGRVVEAPRQMFLRVAKVVAAVEEDHGARPHEVCAVERRFFKMMRRGLFLPNSPTLMNAGRANGMLSACFVLPIDDSIEGIFAAVRKSVLVQAAGGGTGFAFDAIRPAGDFVQFNGGCASGPVAFWRVFAEATSTIQQGALRRGANMAMMSVDHPDILKFITAKQDGVSFPNFNVSVKVTDAFMAALSERPDSLHIVTNPRDGKRYTLPFSLNRAKYRLQDLTPVGQKQGRCYTIRDVWDLIVHSAHATGEPGVCFIDRVNRDNPTPALGLIVATNACGEQPMLAWEACNLGSINVARFVRQDEEDLDWAALGNTVTWAVRFLDNVIGASFYPVQEIRDVTLGNRKIGLGIMGLADALVLLGLRYDSQEAVDFAGRLMGFIQEAAHAASGDLAEERGSFPNWAGSVWETRFHAPMRNASCTTVAPTGSTSVIARCSSGIEPIYLLAFRRAALDGQNFVQVHPLLEQMGTRDGWLTEAVREAMIEGTPAAEIPGIPSRLSEVLVTAHEVRPEWHVRMQAAIQQHVDSAVSKTVNLPSGAAAEDVDKVYRMAHELDSKGITVYRDGSRAGQTLSTATGGATGLAAQATPRPRVRVTKGRTSKFRMGCGTLFVTVNSDEKGLCEVFANLGKAGGCPSQSEATCRAVSAALRSGVDPDVLIEQLRGIRCPTTCIARRITDDVDVLSCPDAIARALAETWGPTPAMKDKPAAGGRACPDCGAPLRREEGCWVCVCGYSKCG